jgi:hypothetical protein
VENAFGLMKENLQEMLNKSMLDVSFVPEVVYACCILHNLTMHRGSMIMDELIRQAISKEEQEMRMRDLGDWRVTDKDEIEYNDRLRHGEVPGDKQRQELVYYLVVQPPHP